MRKYESCFDVCVIAMRVLQVKVQMRSVVEHDREKLSSVGWTISFTRSRTLACVVITATVVTMSVVIPIVVSIVVVSIISVSAAAVVFSIISVSAAAVFSIISVSAAAVFSIIAMSVVMFSFTASFSGCVV